MYAKFLNRWMAMTWEERRKKARTMSPEILECFADALEQEAKILRLQQQQNIELKDLKTWQTQKEQEALEVFAHEPKDR